MTISLASLGDRARREISQVSCNENNRFSRACALDHRVLAHPRHRLHQDGELGILDRRRPSVSGRRRARHRPLVRRLVTHPLAFARVPIED